MGTVPFTMSRPLLRVCDSPDSPFLTEPEPHGYGKILGEALKCGCDSKKTQELTIVQSYSNCGTKL